MTSYLSHKWSGSNEYEGNILPFCRILAGHYLKTQLAAVVSEASTLLSPELISYRCLLSANSLLQQSQKALESLNLVIFSRAQWLIVLLADSLFKGKVQRQRQCDSYVADVGHCCQSSKLPDQLPIGGCVCVIFGESDCFSKN